MVYVLKLEWIYRATYIDIWRPKGNNHGGEKALRHYVMNLSH